MVLFFNSSLRGILRDVAANMFDCYFVVSKSKLQLLYNVRFLEKIWILPAMG